MGGGAYHSLIESGITPHLTDVSNADEAMRAYIGGTLPDLTDKVH